MSDFSLPSFINSYCSPFPGVNFYPIMTNSFALVVSVKDGAAWEEDDCSGYAHFLEHANFLRTDKYASFTEIACVAENLGVRFSAHTTRDSVVYWFYAPFWALEQVFDIASSVISFTDFEDELIEKEKNIIFQESERERGNTKLYFPVKAESMLLSPNPISRYALGTKESVESLNAHKLSAYKKRVYTRENINITLCGGFDSAEAEKLCGNLILNLPSSSVRKLRPYSSQNGDFGVKKFDSPSGSSQLQMILYWLLEDTAPKDWICSLVLNNLLGIGFSSLFYRRLRNEENLLYTFAVKQNTYEQVSNFRFIADIAPEKAHKCLEIVIETIMNLPKTSAQDLLLAKNKVWGDIAFKLSEMQQYALFLNRREFLTSCGILIADLYNDLKALSLGELTDYVCRNFYAEKSLCSFVGTEKSLAYLNAGG